jgi:hypothetical protein
VRLAYLLKYYLHLSSISDVPKVKGLIEERLSGKARDGAVGKNHINENIKEFRESEARRNNIIIFNVNESKSTEAEALS